MTKEIPGYLKSIPEYFARATRLSENKRADYDSQEEFEIAKRMSGVENLARRLLGFFKTEKLLNLEEVVKKLQKIGIAKSNREAEMIACSLPGQSFAYGSRSYLDFYSFPSPEGNKSKEMIKVKSITGSDPLESLF